MSLTGVDPVLLLCLERSEINRKGRAISLEDDKEFCVSVSCLFSMRPILCICSV